MITKPVMWVAASATVLSGLFTFFIARLARGQEGGGSWKEFTVVRVEKSATLRTHQAIQRMAIEAQRADGSRVTAGLSDGGFTGRYIRSVPGRKAIFVDDTLGATTTLYDFGASGSLQPPPADSQCGLANIGSALKPSMKGEDVVLGFKTIAIQTEDGPYLNTVWKAPDLDCATLKMTEDRKGPNGSPDARFDLAAVSVILGTPAPALFEIPATYTEMSPKQQESAQAARLGRTLPESSLAFLERRESQYAENHRLAAELGLVH